MENSGPDIYSAIHHGLSIPASIKCLALVTVKIWSKKCGFLYDFLPVSIEAATQKNGENRCFSAFISTTTIPRRSMNAGLDRG